MDALLAQIGLSLGEIGGLIILAILFFMGMAVLRWLMKLTAKIMSYGCLIGVVVMGLAFFYVLFN